MTGGVTRDLPEASLSDATHRRASGWVRILLALLGATGVSLWLARDVVLARAGAWLVVEDPIARVDAIVVSYGGARAAALEAARLYRRGIAPTVVLASWREDPLDAEVAALGIPFAGPTALLQAVLEHGGIPPQAIETLPARVDGTRAEIAAIASFARARHPRTLLFITARSHTARARWLLRGALPDGVRVLVRSSASDQFSPRSWWRSREQSREVVLEYLRWLDSWLWPHVPEYRAERLGSAQGGRFCRPRWRNGVVTARTVPQGSGMPLAMRFGGGQAPIGDAG